MKVIGLTRIRNEAEIIKETLDHMAEFCNGGIYVYDDDSNDDTKEICQSHHAVRHVIEGGTWSQDRETAEFQNRQILLEYAREHASEQDWFIYMDADERIDFDWGSLQHLDQNILGIQMRLFDFYITDADKNFHYSQRKYIGPEYRDILMLFRNRPELSYHKADQREVSLGYRGELIRGGYVKHYGKAISVQQWEDTCEYYATSFPKYAAKWEARRGKAIHTQSDFGNDLITWKQKQSSGIPLWHIELAGQNILTRYYRYSLRIAGQIRERGLRLFYKIIS